MKIKKDKVKLITLGCAKNLVDSEYLARHIKASDISMVDNDDDAETVIINTCGFINEAKEESINTILRAVKRKQSGRIKNVFVAGCLSDRYKDDLIKEIPDVDRYFGATNKTNTILGILNELGADYKKHLVGERELSTPSHYAYLKISEGCNNPCSFCAIPLMRGQHVSKDAEEILKEAEILASKGVKELIVIGQDTTYWNFDKINKREIHKLFEKLAGIKGIEWIRLMYAYPSRFPVELLDVIREHENICKYIDIPVQHISDNMLKSMRRGITKGNLVKLLENIREKVPGIAIRSTFITGYPEETEKDFAELLEFVSDFRFDRLGVFTYSHEEDTYAFNLKDAVPYKEKVLRQKLILEKQREIALENNSSKTGSTIKVLIDRKENDAYIGRSSSDAPEIDQEIYVSGDNLKIGQFYNVEIEDYEEFDLFGKAVH